MNFHASPRYPQISAAIIAGGMATRMGGAAKAFLDLGGEAILDRQLYILRPRFADLIAAAGSEEPRGETANAFTSRGMRIVVDEFPSAGPLAGLHAALAACKTEWVFALACDMPFLDGTLIDQLATIAMYDDASDALIPSRKGKPEPLHALYRPRLAAEAASCLANGRRAVVDLLSGVNTRLLKEKDLPGMSQSYTWTNLNTPADLEAAAAALSRVGAGAGAGDDGGGR